MNNRIVGFLVIGIAVLIGAIIFIFNNALSMIVATSCSHGTACPMWGTIETQTYISIVLMALVLAIGLYLVFFGRDEIIVTKFKRVKPFIQQAVARKPALENFKEILARLEPEERQVLEKVIEKEGSAFQSLLVESTGFGKVKMTRILDRLEGKGIIERKRRGMTNVVVLKPQ